MKVVVQDVGGFSHHLDRGPGRIEFEVWIVVYNLFFSMHFIRILLVQIYTAHVVALCRRSISTGHGTVSLSFLLSVHDI